MPLYLFFYFWKNPFLKLCDILRINSNYLIFFADNQLPLILRKIVIRIKNGIEPAIGTGIELEKGIVVPVIGTVVPEIGIAIGAETGIGNVKKIKIEIRNGAENDPVVHPEVEVGIGNGNHRNEILLPVLKRKKLTNLIRKKSTKLIRKKLTKLMQSRRSMMSKSCLLHGKH